MKSDGVAPPIPTITEWNRPYFDGAAEGRLMLQRCEICGFTVYYPRIACPNCLSSALGWIESVGIGTIYSYTVVRRQKTPAFVHLPPVVIAAVELSEGVLMVTSIEGIQLDRIRIGLEVEVMFSAPTMGLILPRFRPRATADGHLLDGEGKARIQRPSADIEDSDQQGG